MSQLGIADLFDDVFDIIESEFVPKPARQPYERFLTRHSIAPVRAAMFEDIPRNLEIPAEMGMRTVLVVPDERGDHKDDWERWWRRDPARRHPVRCGHARPAGIPDKSCSPARRSDTMTQPLS